MIGISHVPHCQVTMATTVIYVDNSFVLSHIKSIFGMRVLSDNGH